MKKVISLFVCGAMLASVVLCSCAKTTETEVTEAETKTETAEDEAFEVPWAHELNEENIKKVQEYYFKDSGDVECISVFCDGVRGNGISDVNDNIIYLCYQSLNGDQFDLNVHRDTYEVSFSYLLNYGDTRFYGNVSTTLDGLEAFVDKVISDPGSVSLYDGSALETNEQDIKNDMPILYSRFIKLSSNAYPELGLGLEDLGIVFGDKYRTVDPTQTTSTEVEITNEHNFGNGFCIDCGMPWTEFFNDSAGKLMDHEPYGNDLIFYGQGSYTMLSYTDNIRYTSYGPLDGDISYSHITTDKDTDIQYHEDCSVEVHTYDDSIKTGVTYAFLNGSFYTGSGISYKYRYQITFSADPGEYDKILNSKEEFMNSAEITLDIYDMETKIEDAWETMDEDEIRKIFEEDGIPYMSKDDLVDKFWNHKDNFFASMDSGMVWMHTTLADIGVNWK